MAGDPITVIPIVDPPRGPDDVSIIEALAPDHKDVVAMFRDAGLQGADAERMAVWMEHALGDPGVNEADKDIERALGREMVDALRGETDKRALETARTMLTDAAREQTRVTMRGLIETQVQTIADTIAAGLEDGKGPLEIARRLDAVSGLDSGRSATLRNLEAQLVKDGVPEEERDKLLERAQRQLLRDRRETIARTETAHAHETARLENAKARGAATKVWLTAEDETTCEICVGNGNQGAIPIGDRFESGDDRPPAHPNCRCAIAFGDADDEEAAA